MFVLAAARGWAQPGVSLPGSGAPLPLLDVPFVSQSEALCGGAAAAMVLRYWGERGITAETFAPLVDRSAAGIRTTVLVDDLSRRGWVVRITDSSAEAVATELANGRPLVALIEDRPHVYHYIVIVGATAQRVIFHDPARAPLRVLARDEFERRSKAAGRWMAIVLPRAGAPAVAPPTPTSVAITPCDQRVSEGVAQAQAGDVDAAERTLTAALSCPGASPLRELAGLRLLQRRWDDVVQLSTQAAAIDPEDAYTWQLLGTGRFLLNQPLAALDAWNHAGEPRLDLVKVNGLERTRQRPIERMLGIAAGEMISPQRFIRADRAVRELPSASSTRLEVVPVGQGLAELHATVAERPLVPRDVWSLATIGARATLSRTLGVTFGSLAGSGESLSVEWRYWPRRPAVSASLRVPAPWPGLWGADVFVENQEFDAVQPELQRRGGRLVASRWMTSAMRMELRAGVDRWNTTHTFPIVGVTSTFVTGAERIVGRAMADGWLAANGFGSYMVNVAASTARTAVSGAVPLGPLLTASVGTGAVSSRMPLDRWLAADTGQVRPILLRAHPVLDDGRIRVDRVGRRILYASGEAQFWWKAPALSRIGAAAFLDSARTMSRIVGESVNDMDVGVGLGLASLLVPGRIRLDYAHGLRDGADAVSIRYVTAAW